MNGKRGFSLVELLVVIAILGLTVTIVTADMFKVRRAVDLRRLGQQIFSDTLHCRVAALTDLRNVGLIFVHGEGGWYYCIVEDRDVDGVSRRDYLAGIDKALGPRTWVAFISGGASLGVPVGWNVPDPSGRGTLPPDDGLRIGDSAIVAFTPHATATPSSVYFHDGRDRMIALRVPGHGGNVRLIEWHKGWASWREVK